MTENEIARIVVDSAFGVHTALGPGLLESIYEDALAYELTLREIPLQLQYPIPVVYRGARLGEGYRADMLVAGKVLVELKSVEAVLPVHKKQLMTYLKLTGIRLGLLINFNAVLIKEGITRIVNGLPVQPANPQTETPRSSLRLCDFARDPMRAPGGAS